MIEKIREFFWVCSGVHITKLRTIPEDYVKYASIGATVFFTGLLAALSGGYAMHSVFDNYWVTIPFAIVWGLVIFNLDRYIVSSLVKPKASGKGALVDFFRELPPAIPRFLLAAVIAFAVSNPLELRLFKKEIDIQLAANLEKFKSEFSVNSSYKKQIGAVQKAQKEEKLFKDLTENERQLANFENDYVKEVQGITGTKKYGYGIAAKTLEKSIAALKSRNDSIKSAYSKVEFSNNIKIDSLEKAHNVAFAEQLKQRAEVPGFLAQNMALAQLQASNPTVKITSWFLRLLFLILEISPILVKLLSPKGLYDLALEKTLEDEKTKTRLFHQDLEIKELEKWNYRENLLANFEANLNSLSIENRGKLIAQLKEYINQKIDVNEHLGASIQMSKNFSKARILSMFDDHTEKTIADLLDQLDDDQWREKVEKSLSKYS